MKISLDRRGFTLIELLVVISIIGLLASIVLAGTTSARNKAKDARVISDVQQIRISLHFGFTNPIFADLFNANANGTGVLGGRTDSVHGPSWANLNALETDIGNQTSLVTYYVNTNGSAGFATAPNAIAFAVYGRLVSNNTRYFCMDSSGRTNPSTVIPGSNAAVCP